MLALGCSTPSCFRPRRQGIPQMRYPPYKVYENTLKKGQGDQPLDYLLLSESERVTLISAVEIDRLRGKKRIFAKN